MTGSATSAAPTAAAVRPRSQAAVRGTRAAHTAIGVIGAGLVVAFVIIGVGLYLTGKSVADGNSLTAANALPAAVALLVMLTLRPRGHRFIKPGPRLMRGEQPELFAVLDEATDAVGVAPYDEVYIDGSAEGRVVQRDGLFGVGGERTLQIGAALLQTMSVDHLKALVAHEGLRYYSPDSKLAALVERTRARMRAGLDELAGADGSLTSVPFQICAGFFLRSTDTLSREHRLQTDDHVADAIGGWQMVEMLKLTSGLPAVLEAYGRVYAGPSGPRFEDFAVSEDAARTLAFARFRQSESATASGVEPAIDDRMLRLQNLARDSRPFDERPAATVVQNFAPLAARQMADRFARL